MKKILLTLFAILMMAFSAKADWYEGECGENVYWRVDTTARKLIISGTGAMKDYKACSGINVNGSPWKKHKEYLDTIVVEDGVTRIGNYAFDLCRYTKGIIIGNTVTSIGDCAFLNCENITEINIPHNVTELQDRVFEDCNKLKSVTIPNSVVSIGIQLFTSCYELESIVVEDGNPVYDSRDNCNGIILTESNKLIVGTSITTIPNTVTEIGSLIFCYEGAIESMVIPNSVKKICTYAFYDCGRLSHLILSNSLDTIKERAFWYCPIDSIIIPSSVRYIGESAFYHNNFSSIIVEEDNTSYDSREDCNAVIDSKTGALIVGCDNTIIPNSITSIGKDAFCDCRKIKDVALPYGVTSIGECAFWNCSNLETLSLPKTVEIIYSQGFDYCKKLKTIECLAEIPPTCVRSAFRPNIYDTTELYVPFGCSQLYKAADGWKEFKNIIELTSGYGVDENQSIAISVFPNPATDFVNVNCENMKSLEIYSLDGKQIIKTTVSGDETQIDISELDSGVYVIRIETAVGIVNRKFEKK